MRGRRLLLAAAAGLLALLWRGGAAEELRVTFMDIGRNDGILIECGDEAAFIDSGTHDYGMLAVRKMKEAGVDRLKYYIGTHAHRDHVGGGAPVILALRPEAVLVSHAGVRRQIKKRALTKDEQAAAKAADYVVVSAGEHYAVGAADLEVLGPLRISSGNGRTDLENENSMVLRLTFGVHRFLLTADMPETQLLEIEAAHPGALACDVLKNPHHNGRIGPEVLEACGPEYVVFSTSDDFPPAELSLREAEAAGARPLVTASSRDGTVIFASDGRTLSVRTKNQTNGE